MPFKQGFCLIAGTVTGTDVLHIQLLEGRDDFIDFSSGCPLEMKTAHYQKDIVF